MDNTHYIGPQTSDVTLMRTPPPNLQGPILRATTEIPKGATLLDIPTELWLDAANARKAGGMAAKLAPGESEWLAIALHLRDARAGTVNSPWAAYAKSLPQSGDAPVTSVLLWPEEEQAELLAGTQLLDGVQGYRTYVSAEEERLGIEAGGLLWGFAAARSRRRPPLSSGQTLALVPLVDLVRHAPAPLFNTTIRRPGVFGLGAGGKSVRVEAARAILPGEVLSVNLEDDQILGDGLLLLDYGQAFLTRPVDTHQVSIPVSEDIIWHFDKAEVLEQNGLTENPIPFTLMGGVEPPPELMATLRLLGMKGKDAFLLESIFRKEVWDFCQAPISVDNEQEACQQMVDYGNAALAALGGSDAANAARYTRLATREAVAAYARTSEARVLASTVEYFEGRMQQLRGLEYYQERRLKDLNLIDEDGESTYFDED